MHTRVGWWSEQSILWYERASSRSDFHERLVDLIVPCLEKNETIIEAGCGLGYEAEILKRRGYSIQAYDLSKDVIDAAKRRSQLDIFHCKDFYQLEEKPDTLLCINFGHMDRQSDLAQMLCHAGRKLVCIVSKHSAHGLETRRDRSDLIESLVREKGLGYERKDFSLSFDQPLKSMEEARSFLDWTYLGDSTESYLEFVEKTEDRDYPYIFRNKKKMTQFVVNVE